MALPLEATPKMRVLQERLSTSSPGSDKSHSKQPNRSRQFTQKGPLARNFHRNAGRAICEDISPLMAKLWGASRRRYRGGGG